MVPAAIHTPPIWKCRRFSSLIVPSPPPTPCPPMPAAAAAAWRAAATSQMSVLTPATPRFCMPVFTAWYMKRRQEIRRGEVNGMKIVYAPPRRAAATARYTRACRSPPSFRSFFFFPPSSFLRLLFRHAARQHARGWRGEASRRCRVPRYHQRKAICRRAARAREREARTKEKATACYSARCQNSRWFYRLPCGAEFSPLRAP